MRLCIKGLEKISLCKCFWNSPNIQHYLSTLSLYARFRAISTLIRLLCDKRSLALVNQLGQSHTLYSSRAIKGSTSLVIEHTFPQHAFFFQIELGSNTQDRSGDISHYIDTFRAYLLYANSLSPPILSLHSNSFRAHFGLRVFLRRTEITRKLL